MRVSAQFAALVLCLVPVTLLAQRGGGIPPRPLPDEPFIIDTAEQGPVRVSVTKGLNLPWDMAFLPDGDMLITEREAQQLRIVRNGLLHPDPITGLLDVGPAGGGGLMSVVVHPDFENNGWVYLSYTKSVERGQRAVGLSRGRLDGFELVDVSEIFAASEPGAGPAPGIPLLFGPDGYLFMGVGGADDEIAQRGDSYYGKVLRLNDDGSPAAGNPLASQEGFHPEIYSIGHRNMVGMTVNTATGEVWQNENGPLGGDEVNILKPGANYGWPLVSYGIEYSGEPVSDKRTMEGMEDPALFWVPVIAISGMTFYTGDKFPAWQNNLFVGGLQYGGIARTGQVQRIAFNDRWQEARREVLFADLRQRIRDVEQGPDGYLWVLTDEADGALLKLEPAN